MAATDEIIEQDEGLVSVPGRRRWRGVLAVSAILLVALVAGLWLGRVRLTDTWLSGQLRGLDVPATYRIVRIAPDRQVLRDIVVGDPHRPDLTIEQAEVTIRYGLLGPAIGEVRLVRPRLQAQWRDGRLSLGTLDKALSGGGGEPFRLPDYRLDLVDGRARVDTAMGGVGIKIAGAGHLRDGFAGTIAAIAPRLATGPCTIERGSLYGRLRVDGEKPSFSGPLRIESLDCPEAGVRLAHTVVQADVALDAALQRVEGRAALATGQAGVGAARLGALTGTTRFAWRNGGLTARYDVAVNEARHPGVGASRLAAEGLLRLHHGGDQVDLDGTVQGDELAPGKAFDEGVRSAAQAVRDTPFAPLLGQMSAAIRRESGGSQVSGTFAFRRAAGATSLVVPQARLRGGSGATLLALSRVQVAWGMARTPRIIGNFATGGTGLPQVAGRMERPAGGSAVLRLRMADYSAGGARLAIPRLTLAQASGGALGFAGQTVLSGPLPGGVARDVELPLDGSWTPGRDGSGSFRLWRRCTAVRFASLAFASLALDRQSLTLCPPAGRAVVTSSARGLEVAAGLTSLSLSGTLGQSPLRLVSGPVGFAWPGTVSARSIDVALGTLSAPTRFRLANLTARFGSGRDGGHDGGRDGGADEGAGMDATGRFDGSQVLLAAVPLDMLDAAGTWRFAKGVLSIDDAAFRLEDRQRDDRFVPLNARGASLRLAGNVIDAQAALRAPRGDRVVLRTAIRHDLGTARGHADLRVDGLTFDETLQPTDLTYLARGVVANTRGAIDGQGWIDWTADRVTSGGTFSTAGLDLAAAFGPARGIAGTVAFTDLLGMVTAPDQRLRIASINPGIEATDGELSFQLMPDAVLQVNGARWPFLEGTMHLLPTRMVLGATETRRFTLRMDGISAARFLERMELANLSATGVFDGSLPLVFDENGGHIEGGQLASRAPGGNVSYVGQLTYKDLSPIANFAFDALKSLDYREMNIAMDGALEGEIVTRVRFAGVKQGTGTRQNFLTRRLANLPLLFNINIRAPFFGLITSFKSFYDPTKLRDPRELGLIGADGKPMAPPPVRLLIQPPVSEKKP